MSLKEILETEFSEDFVEKKKNRMLTSYYKYGKVKENYENGKFDALACAKERMELYNETGNTEYLIDASNFLMIEYMYPQHENAHFEGTDSDQSPRLVRGD